MKREITCERCHGTGRAPLPEHLAETLSRIPKRGATTADLRVRMPGVTETAQCNRLDQLHQLNFLRREKTGKFWKYFPL